MYNTAATIRQGVKAGTEAKVLNAKLSLKWTGPYKIIAVGRRSSGDTPDGSPLSAKLLYLYLPSDMPGTDAHHRVSMACCKLCGNPHDSDDIAQNMFTGGADAVRVQQLRQDPSARITSPRTTCRHPSNEIKWRRSPATKRFVNKVQPSRRCTRCIRGVSLAHLGRGKWTSSSHASRFCRIESAPRASTTKPTAYTVGCGLALHNGKFLEETASV